MKRTVTVTDPAIDSPRAVGTVGATQAPGDDLASHQQAGTLLAGRYELRGRLGAGGMGTVYRAWDRALDEPVALKVLRHGALGSQAFARFRKEVKLARAVTHRNVARTFDIGEDGDNRFLTMELINGAALDAVIARQAPLSLEDARTILLQITEGLAAAHAVGVVHRDLKPANVMLESTGRVVVTDFGLARRPEAGDDTQGGVGQILGTPAYMAPEQVEARVEVDARADVYALALIAHELFLGRPAWAGTSPLQVAAARLYEPPPTFAGVPGTLRTVLCRCVERDRALRYADASAVLAALRETGPAESGVALRVDPQRPRETRVAILPFQQSRGAGEDILEGLAEDLADVLSMTPGLRVRHSALRGDAPPPDPVEYGRELGVDVVVIGSVRRLGAQLRVNVRLVGTADRYQLWAGRFDCTLDRAMALNDEVAAAVAAALTAEAPASRDAPSNPQAIEYYLLARKLAARSYLSRERLHLEPLDRALSLAPDDPIVVGMWVFHQMTGRNFEAFRVEPAIEDALRRLVARAPDLAVTHLARAAVMINGRDDRSGSVEWLRRGHRLSPGHADLGYLLGVAHLEAGRPDAALPLLRASLWSDPSPWQRTTTALTLGLLGRFDEARETIDADTSEVWQRTRSFALARLQLWAGRELGRCEHPGDPLVGALVAEQLRVVRGEGTVEAIDLLAQRLGQMPRPSRAWRLFLQSIVELYARVGADDRALAALTEAVAGGLSDGSWIDRARPLDSLRGGGAFEAQRAIVLERVARIAEALDRPL